MGAAARGSASGGTWASARGAALDEEGRRASDEGREASDEGWLGSGVAEGGGIGGKLGC